MEYALITAFLILVIVLSVLAYVGHGFVKNDIKGKTLQIAIDKLTKENRQLKNEIEQLRRQRQTPTLQEALKQSSNVVIPTSYGTWVAPSFTSSQYIEQ